MQDGNEGGRHRGMGAQNRIAWRSLETRSEGNIDTAHPLIDFGLICNIGFNDFWLAVATADPKQIFAQAVLAVCHTVRRLDIGIDETQTASAH